VGGAPLPALLPDGVKGVTFGEGETSPDDVETDDLIADYRPDAPIDDHDGTFTRRFLYAYWRLARQRIAGNERIPVRHVPGRRPEERGGEPRQAHPAPRGRLRWRPVGGDQEALARPDAQEHAVVPDRPHPQAHLGRPVPRVTGG